MLLENQISSFLPFIRLSNREIVFNKRTFAIQSSKGKTLDTEKLQLLTGILYRNCYCRKFASKNKVDLFSAGRPKNESSKNKEDFYQSLQTANKSEAAWAEGWVFQQKDVHGNLIVKKNNQNKLVKADHIKLAPGKTALEKDALLSIKTEREKKTGDNGFYFAFSKAS